MATEQTTFREGAINLLKAVFSYERACAEMRRASVERQQPRLQRAGNRQFTARARMFQAAKELNRGTE